MTSTAWEEVTAATASSPYPVTFLPPNPDRARQCLTTLEVTTRSWLGAVVANTGGILVDHGWLRVLGSGHGDLPDVLWKADPHSRWLTVAVDVLGGHYAWFQAAPDRTPTIHYFGPDVLEWQDLERGYGDWLYGVLSGVLTEFYDTLRWPGWEAEVAGLALSQGITTFPPPSTREGKYLATVARAPVPMAELIDFHHDFARQLGLGKGDAADGLAQRPQGGECRLDIEHGVVAARPGTVGALGLRQPLPGRHEQRLLGA